MNTEIEWLCRLCVSLADEIRRLNNEIIIREEIHLVTIARLVLEFEQLKQQMPTSDY